MNFDFISSMDKVCTCKLSAQNIYKYLLVGVNRDIQKHHSV